MYYLRPIIVKKTPGTRRVTTSGADNVTEDSSDDDEVIRAQLTHLG